MNRILLVLFSFFSFSVAHATSVLYQDFNQMTDNSQHVVGGIVAKVKSKKYKNG